MPHNLAQSAGGNSGVQAAVYEDSDFAEVHWMTRGVQFHLAPARSGYYPSLKE
jgi:hypothetical protein